MKILVICQYYYPEPFRISDVCETLSKKGHEVTVLTGLPNYPKGKVLKGYRFGKRRIEEISGVKVIRCFEIGRGKRKYQLMLNYLSFTISASFKALFFKKKFDLVFVNQLSPITMAIPSLIYKKKFNTKVFLYCLDLWPASLFAGGIKEDSSIYKALLKISRRIYQSVDKIAVTSHLFKDYFENTLKIDSKEILHLPQYAEDLFTENVKVQNTKTFNFVFAGNIGEMQSVETIVEAANLLHDQKHIHFHIVGGGSKLEECKTMKNQLKLNNITFYGIQPVNEMPKYYGLAAAMLITLKDNKDISYTLPGKVQSYMAAGKPIIGAISGETRRVIDEADCGYCCKAEDYEDLARIILEFCKCSSKEKFMENSRKYYDQNYSKNKFFTKLQDTLLRLEG